MAVLHSKAREFALSRLGGLLSLSVGAFLVASLGLAPTTVFALPKEDPERPIPDDREPRDPPSEDPTPNEQPRPSAWPPLDGSVVVSHDPETRYFPNGQFYARTRELPLCEWGKPERSFVQFLYNSHTPGTFGPWACKIGHGNDTRDCTLSNSPALRPTEPDYRLVPREMTRAPATSALSASINPTAPDLVWREGSAAYNTRFIKCSQPQQVTHIDEVFTSRIQGRPSFSTDCQGSDTQFRRTLLAEVFGESTKPTTPSIVLVHASVAYYKGPHDVGNSSKSGVAIAIQVYGPTGWTDFKTVPAMTSRVPQTFEVRAEVPADTLVRAQLRGAVHCDAQYEDGYDIRGFRISVEICVPDAFDPKKCSD
jgi:hypothetical protein